MGIFFKHFGRAPSYSYKQQYIRQSIKQQQVTETAEAQPKPPPIVIPIWMVIVRGICFAIIILCAITGFLFVHTYNEAEIDVGVNLLRELYEYDRLQELYTREKSIRSKCTEEVWSQIGFNINEKHYDKTWGKTRDTTTKVRVVWTKPGIVIYYLENPYTFPEDLKCFEYTYSNGKFISVRETNLVGTVNIAQKHSIL